MSWVITGTQKNNWTPAEITTALWLDAADATTITESGGAVSQWNDKSGNDKHFSQGTAANRPIINSTAINSKPALVFDGINDHLVAGSAVIPTTHSLFVVFVPTIENEIGVLLTQWAANQTGRFLIACNQNCGGLAASGRLNSFNGSTTQGGCVISGGLGFASDVSITNTATIIESISATGSESWKLLKNGTEWDSATITSVYQGVNTALGTLSASQPSTYYDGQLAEIVMTASVLSLNDRQKIEGYLAHKWGLTANLPVDHPYKTALPVP
jgi:hypothetical protein